MTWNLLSRWFSAPDLLGILALVPFAGLLMWFVALRGRVNERRWADQPKLAADCAEVRSMRGLVRGFYIIGTLALIVAAAGPQWGRGSMPETAPGRDLVAVLDMSRSMLAADVVGRSAPNRLGAACDMLIDLAKDEAKSDGNRLGLVVFAARAQRICPLTQDRDAFQELVGDLIDQKRELDIGPMGTETQSGTRIGRGLKEAVAAHDPQRNGFQDIVLLSDGDDPADDSEWREGITAAQRRGIRVMTVGIGDPSRDSVIPLGSSGALRYQGKTVLTRLQEEPLRTIASETGGIYVPTRTYSARLGKIVSEWLASAADAKNGANEIHVRQPREKWFFLAALLFLGGGMVLESVSSRKVKRLSVGPIQLKTSLAAAIVAITLPFQLAGSPSEDVAAGNSAYERGDFLEALKWYAQAEERITDPGLVAFNEGAACYRLGRFPEAEVHYRNALEGASGLRKSESLYNLGNSIIQQAGANTRQRLLAAIQCYEECLGQTPLPPPLFQRANHNLKLAKAWLAHARGNDSHEREVGRQAEKAEAGETDKNEVRSPKNISLRQMSKEPIEQSKPSTGSEGALDSEAPPPGKGNLPLVSGEGEPMTASDVAAYLQHVVDRVRQERRVYRIGAGRVAAPDVKDW